MARRRVRAGSDLEAQIRNAGLDPLFLIDAFTDWKSGPADDHYEFGHDALGIGSRYLYHVHMVPLHDALAWRVWDNAWRRRSRRTSDRYLFYADGGASEGYLLISAIDDPGAHAIWQQPTIIRAWESIADDFCVFGTVP